MTERQHFSSSSTLSSEIVLQSQLKKVCRVFLSLPPTPQYALFTLYYLLRSNKKKKRNTKIGLGEQVPLTCNKNYTKGFETQSTWGKWGSLFMVPLKSDWYNIIKTSTYDCILNFSCANAAPALGINFRRKKQRMLQSWRYTIHLKQQKSHFLPASFEVNKKTWQLIKAFFLICSFYYNNIKYLKNIHFKAVILSKLGGESCRDGCGRRRWIFRSSVSRSRGRAPSGASWSTPDLRGKRGIITEISTMGNNSTNLFCLRW